MALFEIEQYEVHTQKYRVEAESEAEAIKKLFDGIAEAVDNGLLFIEICEDLGLPVEEFAEIAEELRALGEKVDDDVIPSIRSVSKFE